MIHLYTGDGKGKTTAAMGLAARAAGYSGQYVLVVQFMKCGNEGEAKSLRKIGNITFLNNGYPHGFVFQMTDDEKQRLTKEHNRNLTHAIECVRGNRVFMVVLDEITSAYNLGVIDRDAVDALLDNCENVELVLTGRDPTPHMRARADYITEMKLIKHPYVTSSAPARRGVEF